ncbi:MAG: hypothetical protein ACYTG2_10985 [Planctomycetota bacterium]|jgi:hypothetical protein
MNTRTWIVTTCLLALAPAAAAQGLGKVSQAAGMGPKAASTSATADVEPLFEPVSSQLWVDAGFALDGTHGAPVLTGGGVLAAEQTAVIRLENARAYAPAVLVISDSYGPTPFKGGMLIPTPALMHLILRTQSDGTLEIAFAWDVEVQSGLEITLQFVIQDPEAVQGFALSNALILLTP